MEHIFRDFYKKVSDKGEAALKDFLHKAIEEVGETKEAGIILKRYARGESITTEEREILRIQVYDVMKIVGIGVPFAVVPGASIILPFLIHTAGKHNINLLPTAFTKKK
jgi:hypothetical protein